MCRAWDSNPGLQDQWLVILHLPTEKMICQKMSLQNALLPKYKERVKSNQVVTGKCVGSFKERKFIKTCKTVLLVNGRFSLSPFSSSLPSSTFFRFLLHCFL